MKVSELLKLLKNLPSDLDLDVVTGEEWLPERLLSTKQDGDFLFLEFDNQPEDVGGEIEARGFVEHEVTMLKDKIVQLISESDDIDVKADALLTLLLISHENSSSDVIEILEEDASQH
ncbi:hypothetical protein [Vibrio tapetis]|uniref:Uncharacterized protein n=1 Tax=Vibrio tapetis subsp. tapetis TaxID=1671868 RepID=A0A2N8ZA66_9VIBR|nr:hypothetical protein [Vibrio tapetis]SON48790.1 conserved protein of unknown function [Vibrio tapetis subsp. tapetis]